MANLKFSLGRDTNDNQPAQLDADKLNDFFAQICRTRSSRMGKIFICAPLASVLTAEEVNYSCIANRRILNQAKPPQFLPLDAYARMALAKRAAARSASAAAALRELEDGEVHV